MLITHYWMTHFHLPAHEGPDVQAIETDGKPQQHPIISLSLPHHCIWLHNKPLIKQSMKLKF